MGLINDQSRPRLEAWLVDELRASRVAVEDVSRLSGGAISENLALTLAVEGGRLAGRHAAVLRAAPLVEVSASLNKAQEFAVLRVAFAAGVAAPEPLVACDRRLGGVYVMRRAPVAAGIRVVKAEAPQRDRRVNWPATGSFTPCGRVRRLNSCRFPTRRQPLMPFGCSEWAGDTGRAIRCWPTLRWN
jgi:aminoglycoside phosphotransferase (APT) family kinase protein